MRLNLEHLLKINGLSISELARETNIPQPTLYHIISGHTENPRNNVLAKLAKFFNISVEQLKGNESLPCLIPNIIKDQLNLKEIPIIPWELIKKYPLDLNSSEYLSCKKIFFEKNTDSMSFAMEYKNLEISPIFDESTLLIFSPSLTPRDRSFVLVYLSDTDSVEFNRLFIDGNDYFLKKEINKNISLIKIKSNHDKIIGVLIESRTVFNS